jgi:hypothetical protein
MADDSLVNSSSKSGNKGAAAVGAPTVCATASRWLACNVALARVPTASY